MATYAIGDIQGCLPMLETLLDHCRFDPGRDRLIFTGDLVARGPDSLGSLRFVRGLGEAAITVLGNHDLNLLAVAHGHRRVGDGLEQVLEAADGPDLIDWLRHQRLAWLDRDSNTLVVHAGVAPQWTSDDTMRLAGEIESVLRDDAALQSFLSRMYGNEPDAWSYDLGSEQRRRFAVNCLTRARYCTPDGHFEFSQKGTPGTQPAPLVPWFAANDRATRTVSIVFGHWSTLGRIEWPEWNVFGIDTGGVWGGQLTALRLEDRQLIQVSASTVTDRISGR